MKLYVCWGTFPTPRPGGHPCANAYKALKAAGHDPEVIKSYGLFVLPDALNKSEGRQEALKRTGKSTVPILVLDDDTTIADSKNIMEWAKANPA
jgi:hypothetical protein